MKSGNITTDTEEIVRIIRSYFKNLYSTKLENLKEMDNFLCRYNRPIFLPYSVYLYGRQCRKAAIAVPRRTHCHIFKEQTLERT